MSPLSSQASESGRPEGLARSIHPDDEPARLKALAARLGLEYYDTLDPYGVDRTLLRSVPIAFAKRYGLLPLKCCTEGPNKGCVLAATADPVAYAPLDDLRVLVGSPIVPVVAPAAAILSYINQLYERPFAGTEQMMQVLTSETESELDQGLDEPIDLLDAADEAPLVRLVHSILYRAVKRRASDIHFESFEREVNVRYRIDGVLYHVLSPPKRFQGSIFSRIKVMAGLDIAERRLPQDGRIRIRIAGKDVDIRVSVIPTAHGERIVLRLLDKTGHRLTFEDLGLLPSEQATMDRLIHLSHGLILGTGPTGSGKTTTLYAALTRINSSEKNILTVEDPIEYQIHGIGQMQVHPKIELTFANGLRSILRQDPDVIMVGEIRDRETADIAIHAALTGHLVFSTLHTNDAAGAVTRLLDMGLEPFLVSSSLSAVAAQRLIRVLCEQCKQAYRPSESDLAQIGVSTHQILARPCYRATGCEACSGTGYQGRSGLFELLLVDEEVRRLILAKADAGSIREAAIRRGMITLKQAGIQRVLSGSTTIDEVTRVLQDDVTG